MTTDPRDREIADLRARLARAEEALRESEALCEELCSWIRKAIENIAHPRAVGRLRWNRTETALAPITPAPTPEPFRAKAAPESELNLGQLRARGPEGSTLWTASCPNCGKRVEVTHFDCTPSSPVAWGYCAYTPIQPAPAVSLKPEDLLSPEQRTEGDRALREMKRARSVRYDDPAPAPPPAAPEYEIGLWEEQQADAGNDPFAPVPPPAARCEHYRTYGPNGVRCVLSPNHEPADHIYNEPPAAQPDIHIAVGPEQIDEVLRDCPLSEELANPAAQREGRQRCFSCGHERRHHQCWEQHCECLGFIEMPEPRNHDEMLELQATGPIVAAQREGPTFDQLFPHFWTRVSWWEQKTGQRTAYAKAIECYVMSQLAALNAAPQPEYIDRIVFTGTEEVNRQLNEFLQPPYPRTAAEFEMQIPQPERTPGCSIPHDCTRDRVNCVTWNQMLRDAQRAAEREGGEVERSVSAKAGPVLDLSQPFDRIMRQLGIAHKHSDGGGPLGPGVEALGKILQDVHAMNNAARTLRAALAEKTAEVDDCRASHEAQGRVAQKQAEECLRLRAELTRLQAAATPEAGVGDAEELGRALAEKLTTPEWPWLGFTLPRAHASALADALVDFIAARKARSSEVES